MELLVHISAPTSKKDDDRYRAQALAYLDFEPARVHRTDRVPVDTIPSPVLARQGQEQHQEEPDFKYRNKRTSTTASGARKELGAFPGLGLLATSMAGQPSASFPGPASTPLQKLEVSYTRWKRRQPPNKTPRPTPKEAISDTQLLLDTQYAVNALETQIYSASTGSTTLTLSSPLEERPLKRLRSSQETNSLTASIPIPDSARRALSEIAQNSQRSERSAFFRTPDRVDPLSSQLPETYDLSKTEESGSIETPKLKGSSHSFSTSGERTPEGLGRNTSNSFPVGPQSKQNSTSRSPTYRTNSPSARRWPSQQSPTIARRSVVPKLATRENLPPPKSVRNFSGKEKAQINNHDSPQSSQRRQPSLSKQRLPPVSEEIKISFLLELQSLPCEIYPPNPPTGSSPGREATFMTEVLQKLASALPLVSRYNKFHRQSRPIENQERGYWRIDPRPWPLAAQIMFWKELMKFLERGRAGLATWCSREVFSAASACRQSLGIINVWCFGEIVMPVYLFLYSLAGTKLRQNMQEWIDVDGEVVVQVSAKKEFTT